jgi:hypothetical protein
LTLYPTNARTLGTSLSFLPSNCRSVLSTTQDSILKRHYVMNRFPTSSASSTVSPLPEPDCSGDLEEAHPKTRAHRTLAPNLTRRSHKKSRGGCFNCKTRKIKVRPSLSRAERDGDTPMSAISQLRLPAYHNRLVLTTYLHSARKLAQAVKTVPSRSSSASTRRKQINTSNGVPTTPLVQSPLRRLRHRSP